MYEAPATFPASNALTRISARYSWVVTNSNVGRFVETAQVIHLPTAEFPITLLLPDKRSFLSTDMVPDPEIEKRM